MTAVQGGRASGSADRGSPVKVGGVYNATQPTFTDGNRGDLQIDSKGSARVALYGADSANGITVIGSPQVDGRTTAVTGVCAWSMGALYNGNTWDRARGNLDNASLIAATAATSTQNGADQTNYNHRGVIVVYDATAVTGSGSFTITIQGKDPVSGKYYTLLAGSPRSTTGTDVLTVYPGVTVAANVAASMPLPRTWRVIATYNSGTNQTFTVSAGLIL